MIRRSLLKNTLALSSALKLSGGVVAALLLLALPLQASDHADPVALPMPWELFNDGKPNPKDVKKLTGGITDLFVFPIKKNEEAASFPRENELRREFTPEERAKLQRLPQPQRAELAKRSRAERSAELAKLNPDAASKAQALSREELAKMERLTPLERTNLQRLTEPERAEIDALVIILCVRRSLIQPPPYDLEPYTYSIFMDHHTTVSYDREEDQASRARYGGNIDPKDSTSIEPDITIKVQLKNDATFKNKPAFQGLVKTEKITAFAGVRDDPFIFPPFFGTNVVAMAFKVPLECFPNDKRAWIVWATSHRDGRQVDHVGRSLRSQQPRFSRVLNTLPPKAHVAALDREKLSPFIVQDIAVRAGVPALFNYRDWDRVPDVMIYNSQYNARFPNGRLLTDDVAALLAENGDALLLELSYQGNTWPRATQNDKSFLPAFPYLAAPWRDGDPGRAMQAPPHGLSRRNKTILLLTSLVLFLVPFVLGWLISDWRCRKRARERYR